MKVKVIKRAELESIDEKEETARKAPKRIRLAEKVEKWVSDIHEKAEAESRISFEQLFEADPGSST